MKAVIKQHFSPSTLNLVPGQEHPVYIFPSSSASLPSLPMAPVHHSSAGAGHTKPHLLDGNDKLNVEIFQKTFEVFGFSSLPLFNPPLLYFGTASSATQNPDLSQANSLKRFYATRDTLLAYFTAPFSEASRHCLPARLTCWACRMPSKTKTRLFCREDNSFLHRKKHC